MKRLLQIFFKAFLLLLSVNLLSACTPKESQKGSTSPAPQAPGGTSDSGGCNGIENKCFDSYIIDPTTLPAFKNVVAPLLSNIQPFKSEKASSFETAFRMKQWYLAPVDLQKISKDALGVSFVQSEIQQIAIQTKKAVWIDKRIFDKMSEKDQGELLLHEYVMMLYFIRFMSVQELCDLSKISAPEQKGCEGDISKINELLPAEDWRPLNEDDNERIRFVTAWMLQNLSKPTKEATFVEILSLHGFDRRFLNPESYLDERDRPKKIEISRKEMIDAFKASELSGLMPDTCSDSNAKNSGSCQVKFEIEKAKFFGTETEILRIRVQNHKTILGSVALVVGEKVELNPMRSDQTKILYLGSGGTFNDRYQRGDKIENAYFLFEFVGPSSNQQLVLNSIILRKGVIVSIDKSRESVCRLMPPKLDSPLNSDWFVHRVHAKPLWERLFFDAPLFAFCTKDNVDE